MLKIFRKFKVIGYMHNKNNSLTKCFSYKFSISNNISENDGNDDSGESFTGSSACLGDSAHGFLEIFTSQYNPVSKHTKVVLLTAPENAVTINFGAVMNSWYDIKELNYKDQDKFLDPKKFDKFYSLKEVESNTKRIQQVLDEELKVLNNQSNKLFIGGFSQGCAMSLHAGLTYDKKLGGIFGLSGYLFSITKLENLQFVPLYLFHGIQDNMIPLEAAQKSYERLFNFPNSINLRFHKFHNLNHSVNLPELKRFSQYFQKSTQSIL